MKASDPVITTSPAIRAFRALALSFPHFLAVNSAGPDHDIARDRLPLRAGRVKTQTFSLVGQITQLLRVGSLWPTLHMIQAMFLGTGRYVPGSCENSGCLAINLDPPNQPER